MSNNDKAIETTKDVVEIRENYEDPYWLKKYGVSAEELKATENNIALSNKIIKANFKNKIFA